MSSATAERLLVPTGTWEFDPAHSKVGFAVDYLVGTFSGSFSPVQGVLESRDDGTVALKGEARADAIHVQDENLNAHLLSPEFFDVERTPELKFESHEIARTNDGVRVVGELTIRGVAQPVTLTGKVSEPLTDPYGRERVGLTLNGSVDRTAFGLDWNAPLPSGEPALANEVALSADLFFVKA
jgi:polyisoprenoid-binding protein YceI